MNIIRQYIFDLRFTEKELATALQDTVSRIFNGNIASATSELFDKLIPGTESLWLDNLELDLGAIAYENIERDLANRLMETLESAILEKLVVTRQMEEPGALHFHSQTDKDYALLSHYLQTGTLPWWAKEVVLEDVILKLIKDRHFARFLINIAQADYVVKRIVYHFSSYIVEQIITSLEEEQAAFIFGYTKEVIALQSQKALVKSEQSEFEKAVWVFVLTYLVTENSGQFNRKQFIRRNLERLALHFNIDYARLLETFHQALDFYRKDSFSLFIRMLYEENGSEETLLQEVYNELVEETPAVSKTAYQEIPGEPVNVFVPGITRASPDIPLPLSWINYDSITIQTERQEVWQQAIQLFSTFVTGQQLPYWFATLPEARQAVLLRQAVILLFRKRPLTLLELWERGTRTLSSRLYVHQLFEKPVTPLEETIRLQLQSFAEKDTLAYFKQTLGDTFIQQRENFLEIWQQYHSRPQSERLAFYQQILSASLVVQQVALHLPESDFWLLMQDVPSLWANHTVVALQQFQQLTDSLLSDNLERDRIRLLFRQFNLLWLAGKVSITDTQSYAREWMVFLSSFNESATRKLLTTLSKGVDTSNYMHIQPILPLIPEQEKPIATPKEEPPARKPSSKPIAMSEQEGIQINNAGLVLLHPFFYTYFTRLQLLTNGKFNDEAAQQRAIRLLQLLADPAPDHPEHTLALNKILCNFPLEQPLQTGIVLTEDEKQLSVQLINAAMQQWSKMNNTSVDGFRASFLKREGLLWQKDGAWFLRVTTRSYDIILQTLPWSMGMIKPSWTDKILYTEWNFI